jgi:hypothetical protein
MIKFIARIYLWFYHILLQRPEPFTRQADRMERKWPYLTYGIALALMFITARLDSWWLVITFVVYAFFLWFMPHINSYQREHPDNEPYSIMERIARWAKKQV